MSYSFSASSWQDDTCKLGAAPTYDQASYDAYIKKVHDTRIAVTVVVVLVFAVAFLFGICVCRGRPEGGALIIGIASVVLLITIIPVYTAL